MAKARQKRPTHLFTVRLWNEQLSREHSEWRGQVRHVMSEESCFFRDWETLVHFLTRVRDETSAESEIDES
jgi:hypothetical protein